MQGRDEYVEAQQDSTLRVWLARGALWGSVSFLALSLKDLFVAPELFVRFLLWRALIAACLFGIAMLVKWKTDMSALWLRAAALLGVALSAATIENMVLQSGGGDSVFFVGHILLGVCVMGFIPAGPRFHALSFIVIQSIYALPIIATHGINDPRSFINANFFITAIFISSGIISYLANLGIKKELALRYDLLKAEEGLVRSKEELELRVEERTSELSDLNARLEQEAKQRALSDTILQRYAKRLEAYTTEILDAQNAFKNASDEWRATFDAAQELIVMLDKDLRVIKVNRAASAFFDLPFRELIGRQIFDLCSHCMPSDDRNPINRLIKSRAQEEEELYLKDRDIWVLVSADPILDPDGGLQGAVMFIRDITELKRTQSSLAQMQKMDTIGRLAGGIAHDFNNILSVIIGYTESVRRAVGSGPLRDELDKIHSAGERASDLTRQLLAISRKQLLDLRPMDLNKVVLSSLQMLKRVIGERIDIRFIQAGDVPSVLADQGQIEQVIMNLMINARDAMPDGGEIEISIDSIDISNKEQTRAHLKPGHYVVLRVSDTGMGMDAEVQSRLFEPFFTTKGVGKGTGLGLATIYAIVTQHKGAIDVQTAPGAGTVFSVYLPATTEQVMAQAGQQAPEPLSGGSEHILVVDDDEMLREFILTCLGEFGYRLSAAKDGADALLTLRASAEENVPVELVLTDIVMPGMDGRVLGGKIREEFPDVKVIYMTGYSNDVFHDGPAGEIILQKPFGIDDILRKAREALDGRPVPVREDAPAMAGIVYQADRHRRLRILLVDDDQDHLTLLKMYMENYFDLVDTATDGLTGMEMFKARPYDAVVLDMQMPGPNGIVCAKEIRGWESGHGACETVLILLTGGGLPDEDPVDHKSAGFTYCLQKPVDISALVAAICSADQAGQDSAQACIDPGVIRMRERIMDMRPAYVENKIRDASSMREALARGEMDTVARLGHSIKGSGGSYGLDEISSIGREIEAAARAGDGLTTALNIDRLEQELQDIRKDSGG